MKQPAAVEEAGGSRCDVCGRAVPDRRRRLSPAPHQGGSFTAALDAGDSAFAHRPPRATGSDFSELLTRLSAGTAADVLRLGRLPHHIRASLTGPGVKMETWERERTRSPEQKAPQQPIEWVLDGSRLRPLAAIAAESDRTTALASAAPSHGAVLRLLSVAAALVFAGVLALAYLTAAGG